MPVRHPLLHSSFNRKVMGVPLPKSSGVIMPGVVLSRTNAAFAVPPTFSATTSHSCPQGARSLDVFRQYTKSSSASLISRYSDENFLKIVEIAPSRMAGVHRAREQAVHLRHL